MVMNVFSNKYLIMRHGESEANVAGLIVSDPAIGCERYGLTELGRQQVLRSVTDYMLANLPTEALSCSCTAPSIPTIDSLFSMRSIVSL